MTARKPIIRNATGAGLQEVQLSSSDLSDGPCVPSSANFFYSSTTTGNYGSGAGITVGSGTYGARLGIALLYSDQGDNAAVLESDAHLVLSGAEGFQTVLGANGGVIYSTAFLTAGSSMYVQGFAQAWQSVSTNFTIADYDDTVLVDATSGALTIKMPSSPANGGEVFSVKKIDSSVNSVTLNGNGRNIDTASSYVLSSQGESVTVQWDNSDNIWRIIASHSSPAAPNFSTLAANLTVAAGASYVVAAPLLVDSGALLRINNGGKVRVVA